MGDEMIGPVGGARDAQKLHAPQAADGDEVTRLHALAIHLHRSVCHKTSAARISLYTLLGLRCAHPRLRELLRATNLLTPPSRARVAHTHKGWRGGSSAFTTAACQTHHLRTRRRWHRRPAASPYAEHAREQTERGQRHLRI